MLHSVFEETSGMRIFVAFDTTVVFGGCNPILFLTTGKVLDGTILA